MKKKTAASGGPLLVLVGAAVVLRFVGLAKQGFWYDEANTAYLVGLRPRHMLDLLPATELTPPLYYSLAWVWVRVLGSGEAGLRSLSALAGVLTVPVMYAVGRQLASRRAGLIAAGLAATSPLLVWYSQEARSYALFGLLSAASLLLFLRARESPAGRDLAAWAVVSVVAVATHYFAALVVVPEGALLIGSRRREAVVAVGAVALLAAGLAPLALHQLGTHHSDWIAKIPLSLRLQQLGAQFVDGFGSTPALLTCAGAGLAAGAVLLFRDPAARRAVTPALLVAGAGAFLAGSLAALGADELVTRNLIALWPALAATLALGLAVPRRAAVSLAAAALVCAAWVATDIRVQRDVALQRPDWRRVLRVLGVTHVRRLIVLEHYPGQLPLRIYDPTIRRLVGSQTVRTAEVDVVAAHTPYGHSCWWGSGCNLSPAHLPTLAPPGLHAAGTASVPSFRIERFTASRPVDVNVARLKLELAHVGNGAVLVQPSRRG